MFVKERKNLESEEEEKEVRGRGTLKNEKWEKVLGKGRMERRRKRLGKGRRRDEEGGKREGGASSTTPPPGLHSAVRFPPQPQSAQRTDPFRAKPSQAWPRRASAPQNAAPLPPPPPPPHPRLASPSPTGNGAVTHLSALN